MSLHPNTTTILFYHPSKLAAAIVNCLHLPPTPINTCHQVPTNFTALTSLHYHLLLLPTTTMSTIFHFHLSPANIHYQPLPSLANSPHQLPMVSPLKTTHHLHSNSPMFTNLSHRAEKWWQAMVYANRSDRWRWIASD